MAANQHVHGLAGAEIDEGLQAQLEIAVPLDLVADLHIERSLQLDDGEAVQFGFDGDDAFLRVDGVDATFHVSISGACVATVQRLDCRYQALNASESDAR